MADLRSFALAHPNAAALAIADNGVDRLPLPEAVRQIVRAYEDILANPQPAASTLDMVRDTNRTEVMVAFARCWHHGYAHCMSEVPGIDGPTALTFWDLRPEVGAIIVVHAPDLVIDSDDHGSVPLLPRRLEHQATDGGLTLAVDDATPVLLGWTSEDLVGRARIDFIHPDDCDGAIANWVEMLAFPGESSRNRLRFQTKAGAWIWFEVTQTNLLESHGYVAAEMLDITDEMAAASALQERERLLARLTEALPTGVLHVGPHGQIRFVNERFTEITGMKVTHARQYLDLLSSPERKRVEAALDTTRGQDIELEMTVQRGPQVRRCRLSVRQLGADSGVLFCVDDITDTWLLHAELEQQATTDALTGVANRSAILALLEDALEEASSAETITAVVFLDLDGFKQVNDRHGHAVGDRLLVEVARSLQSGLRPGDYVGRLGGDEFLAVCQNLESSRAAELVAERLEDLAHRTLTLPDGTQVVSRASVGVSFSGTGPTNVEDLVAEADAAMYRRKTLRAETRRALEAEIASAEESQHRAG